MHCLEIIKKINGQAGRESKKSGRFEFDKDAGCLVYHPPVFNCSKPVGLPHLKDQDQKR